MNNIATDCTYCLEPLSEEPEQKAVRDKRKFLRLFNHRAVSKSENVSEITTLINCGHQFHTKCVRDWVVKKRTCPNCRQVTSMTDVPLHNKNINSLLIRAAVSGDLQAVEFCLNSGADITASKNSNGTPLRHAVKHNHFEVAELLINRSLVVDAEACTELALRYLYFHPDVVNKQRRAFELTTIAEEHNGLAARRNLGILYIDGIGVTQNQLKGFQLLEKAANQGDSLAQKRLGTIFFYGQGTNQDYQQSFKWFRKSAKQGEPESQKFLSLHYYNGLGIRQDYTLAKQWCKKSAINGNPIAMASLGAIYLQGDAGEKNIPKAFHWVEKALKLDPENPDSLYLLGYLYMKESEEYAKGLVLITKAKDLGNRKARQYLNDFFNNVRSGTLEFSSILRNLLEATKRKNARIYRLLGTLYTYGIGVEKNYAVAIFFLKKAATRNDAHALNQLSYVYSKLGKYQHAFTCTEKAANQGLAQAQNNLGIMHLDGIGTERSTSNAVFWLQKAAEQNNDSALNELAIMYMEGKILEQNHYKAFNCFMKAALSGNSSAQYSLGFMFINGTGTAPDEIKAIHWFTSAEKAGNPHAQQQLRKMNIQHG